MMSRLILGVVFSMTLAASLVADTLVLRNGTRIEGQLLAVRDRPMPNRPAAALIAKIGGDSTDYFFVGGEQGPIRVRASGRLYLGVNDDFLNDNSGTFRVVIYH